MRKTVITAGLILLSVAGLSGCGRNREFTKLSTDIAELEQFRSPTSDDGTFTPADTDLSEGEATESPQLTALADTLEEAQEIADLYGIELESYSYGVAAYKTDKNISELINMGLEKGYPTLAPNYKNQLHTAQ